MFAPACTFYGEHPARALSDATGGEGLERVFWKDVQAANWVEVERALASNYSGVTPGGIARSLSHARAVSQWQLKDYALGDLKTELNGTTIVVTYTITLNGSSEWNRRLATAALGAAAHDDRVAAAKSGMGRHRAQRQPTIMSAMNRHPRRDAACRVQYSGQRQGPGRFPTRPAPLVRPASPRPSLARNSRSLPHLAQRNHAAADARGRRARPLPDFPRTFSECRKRWPRLLKTPCSPRGAVWATIGERACCISAPKDLVQKHDGRFPQNSEDSPDAARHRTLHRRRHRQHRV